jgi:hypothetical protein
VKDWTKNRNAVIAKGDKATIAEKDAYNVWDSIDDFIAVLEAMRAGDWVWVRNSRCKYVELRVDMRNGGCLIRDQHGNRINPSDLRFQFPRDDE